jgi:hypothetical protein
MSYATAYVDGLLNKQALDNLTGFFDTLIQMDQSQQLKQRPYSELLEEHYRHGPRGSIIFASGPTYTRQELAKLKGMDDADKVQIHNIKRIFKGGEIL